MPITRRTRATRSHAHRMAAAGAVLVLALSYGAGFAPQVTAAHAASTNDIDGDGIANGVDRDVDGDGIGNGNIREKDIDGDGLKDTAAAEKDMDADGLRDGRCSEKDIDGDGRPNTTDPDIDGDGRANTNPLDTDIDGDGIPNATDADANGDCVPDASTPPPPPPPPVGTPIPGGGVLTTGPCTPVFIGGPGFQRTYPEVDIFGDLLGSVTINLTSTDPNAVTLISVCVQPGVTVEREFLGDPTRPIQLLFSRNGHPAADVAFGQHPDVHRFPL